MVDLLENKAYTFEGEHGEKIIEIPIPDDMKEKWKSIAMSSSKRSRRTTTR